MISDGQALGTIQDDDDSPVANPDVYGLNRGDTLVKNAANGVIRGTGLDTDGDTAVVGLTATLVTPPVRADSFTLNGNGSFTYDHDGSIDTPDSFSYFLTDSGGNTSDTALVTLNITNNNAAPILTAGSDQSADEGSKINIDANFTDTDVDDIHIASIDWGDGETSGGVVDDIANTVDGTHAYADEGIYTATITISDGLDEDTATLTATIANVAPSHSVDAVTTNTDEGSEITFTTTPSDPGVDDVFTYTWDVLRNGVVSETWVDPAHGPTSTFPFTPDDDAIDGTPIVWWARVRVDDGDGADPRRAKKVTVNNVDPSATMKADGVVISEIVNLGDEGTKVRFTVKVTDPAGASDTYTYAWAVLRLGQTVATGSKAAFSFTPPDNGTYIVTVDVDDDDNPGDGTTGAEAVFASFDNVRPLVWRATRQPEPQDRRHHVPEGLCR